MDGWRLPSLSSNAGFGGASQWATSRPDEVAGRSGASASFTCPTVAAAFAASGTFTTAFALGTYCLEYTEAGNARPMKIPVSYTSEATAPHTSGCAGFFWRPKTNPTTAPLAILGPDSGGANGWSLEWDTSKSLIIRSLATDTTLHTLSTAPDTAEVYQGVTNPVYFIQVRVFGDGRSGVRIYKWGDTAGAFPATPTEELIFTVTANASFYWLGTIYGSPSGSWDMANLYWLAGSGFWGPVGCNMASGTVDAGVVPVTNSATWRDSGGGADGVAAESDDIAELIPSTADWLKNVSGSLALQYHSVVNGIVPGTPNILAVHVGYNRNVAGGGGGYLAYLAQRLNGAVAKLRNTETITAGSLQLFNWFCTSQKAGGGEYVYGDINNLEIGIGGADFTAPRNAEIYSVHATIVYGPDSSEGSGGSGFPSSYTV